MTMNPAQAAAMRDSMLGKLENENKGMLAVLEHLPEDKLQYKPHEKLKTFAELTHHIYATGTWFTTIMETGKADFTGGGEGPPVPGTKAALIEACRKMSREMAEKAASLSAETLAKEIPFGNFGTYPAVAYLDWHLNHLIHHRGQLTVYLRTMGAKVPAIYGDSLDYPLMM